MSSSSSSSSTAVLEGTSSVAGSSMVGSEGDKHPLHGEWSLWYDQKRKKTESTWGGSLVEVTSIGTVEDFWRLFNNILSPAELPPGTSLFLFRKGVKPAWEDRTFSNGGRFRAQVLAKRSEDTWMDSLMLSVGEVSKEHLLIQGVNVSLRQAYLRIDFWISDVRDDSKTKSLREDLLSRLSLKEEELNLEKFH